MSRDIRKVTSSRVPRLRAALYAFIVPVSRADRDNIYRVYREPRVRCHRELSYFVSYTDVAVCIDAKISEVWFDNLKRRYEVAYMYTTSYSSLWYLECYCRECVNMPCSFSRSVSRDIASREFATIYRVRRINYAGLSYCLYVCHCHFRLVLLLKLVKNPVRLTLTSATNGVKYAYIYVQFAILITRISRDVEKWRSCG